MYLFKGFVTIRPLWSNAPNVIAPIGELSAYSSTFAKDTQLYAKPSSDVAVVGFSSTLNSTAVATPSVVQAGILDVAEWVDARQKVLTIVENSIDFKLAFDSQFPTAASNSIVGEMVAASSGRLYPSYISWKITGYATDNICTLYFSDGIFRQNYDESEVVVIPPLKPIDTFFGSWAEVGKLLDAVSYTETISTIQETRGESPETILTSEVYNYVNALNTTALKPTGWTFLVYGPRGNDPDAIKQALINYIARNSLLPIDRWKVIFPDIFKTTEFLFLPNWANYAIPNMTLTLGLYSPVVSLTSEMARVKRLLPSLPDAHLSACTCTMGYPYRSMSMSIVGSPDNRDSKFKITDIFPDLLAVSSTSLDFNRMTPATKALCERLSNMIYIAETATGATVMPSGYRKSLRDGVSYVTSSVGNINYLVATRNNLFT
jgi:hypothetical protein